MEYKRNGANFGQLVKRINQFKEESDEEFLELTSSIVDRLNHSATLKRQELISELQIAGRNLDSFINLLVNSDQPTPQRVVRREDEDYRIVVELTEHEKKLVLGGVENLLLELGNEIIQLQQFIRKNFGCLIRIAVYYDEKCLRKLAPWFIAQMAKEPFACTDTDRLILRLSLCWERFRNAQSLVQGRSDQKQTQGLWKPPESFVRSTTKYWIRPNKVAAAKVFIVRYVPYLVFGWSSEEMSFLVNPYGANPEARTVDENDISEGQLVTSIYLDNEQGDCYRDRILRYEGAELTRFRWYGENNGSPNKEIFIERKTHHEGWTGEKSTKERFWLPQKRVFDFLKGKIDIDRYCSNLEREGLLDAKKIANLRKLGAAINQNIQTKRLQPMVRTSYLRSAFQASDNNDVRFSLDVNLCMVNEYQPYNHPNEPWCRFSEEVLGKNEVVRFPYAVLEVKLQREQPSWVTEMLAESEAMMVYKFSKFQHGMAFLHRDRIENWGIPHWIPEFESHGYVPGFSIPPATMDAQSANSPSSGAPSQAGFLPASGSGYLARFSGANSGTGSVTGASPKKRGLLISRNRTARRKIDPPSADFASLLRQRAKTIQKLDPKSIFASERVLLHYIQKCLFVIALSLALMEIAGTHITKLLGLILAFVAIGGIVMSYFVFTVRTRNIVSRISKFSSTDVIENTWAPPLICLGVGGALVIVICTDFWLALKGQNRAVGPELKSV